MTADVLQMRPEQKRAESDEIAERRTDAIRRHPVRQSTCSPFSALMHRVAALITTEDLPPAAVTISAAPDEVLVNLTGTELVENGVRRWAAALGLDPVTEAPSEVNGWAATMWSTSGFADGAWFSVSGYVLLPTPIVDRFGCGIGPAT